MCMYDGLISKLLYIQSDNGNKTWPLKESVTRFYLRGDIESRNRFKGLDLIDRVPDELWMEVCDFYKGQGSRPSPRKTKAKKQNSCLKRPYKWL